MIKTLSSIVLLLLFYHVLPGADIYDPLYVRSFPAQGPLVLTISDEINSPIYSWPSTLLTYPVDFSKVRVRPEQMVLRHATTGIAVPIQLSEVKSADDGTVTFAKISFFSDLKPGDRHQFQLDIAKAEIWPALPVVSSKDAIEIDGKGLVVRLPNSRSIASSESAPPPIVGLNAGFGWCGGGKISSPVKVIQSLETTCVASGPLFGIYRLHYIFAQGGSYDATVRIVSGYPFVELTEQIIGLTAEDQAVVEFTWNGLNATRRMPMSRKGWLCPADGLEICKSVTIPGIIEEPHWMPHANTVEDPSKEMIFRLAAFQGNSTRDAVPAISFWEEGVNGQELGFFVPDAKSWDDRQYMVWQPTTLLQVRFRHVDGRLTASYPIVEGKRETGIALHSVVVGKKAVAELRNSYDRAADGDQKAFIDNGSEDYRDLGMRYALWLRSWYSGLSLDKVKDWVLTAPEGNSPVQVPVVESVPPPGRSYSVMGASDLVDKVFKSSLMTYPLGFNVGIDAIGHRNIRPFVEGYLKYGAHLTLKQRRRLDALLLLSAYVNNGDDLAPSRCCISGTPNISSDGFSVAPELSVLYPKHPLLVEWADQFEKRQQLMGCYYTRPEVKTYDSLGGRWCESLAGYNWAYFHSSLPANISLELTDGKNRFASPWMALRGRWLTDELSAPVYNPNPYWRQNGLGFDEKGTTSPLARWKPGIALTAENGFERQYPAHGAHGSGTGQPVPESIPVLAGTLRKYDPMTAEHLYWATAQRTSSIYDGKGNYWYSQAINRNGANAGTDPHLKSSKYTGHGIILRSGVGTPEELSIHLDQADQGPNYRWGWNGENSSGVLYFFASGQAWSGHERENTGDHSGDDATGTTTFAVVKDGKYHSIGNNVLERPLYDLGVAQFGTITSRSDLSPYSWPVYKSRSIMLVGTDYFILCDEAIGDVRFSWFTMKDLPFPKLIFLSPLGTRGDHWSEVNTAISKGVIRDVEKNQGAHVVLVSHKKNEVEMEKMTAKPVPFLEKSDIHQYAWKLPKGEKSPVAGVYWVKTPTSRDVIFRKHSAIHYRDDDGLFSGTAGVVRNKLDGSTELALCQGTEIGAKGVKLSTLEGSELGFSATFKDDRVISGVFMAPKEARFIIEAPGITSSTLYVDGEKHQAIIKDGTLITVLPVGRHTWELSEGRPTPLAPSIVRTENVNGGARIIFNQVAGADRYWLEVSTDGGKLWQPSGASQGVKSSPLDINGLTNGVKYHVRVVAANDQKQSVPGNEYPIYVTDKAPESPDGLDLILSKDRIDLSWGEILGAKEYRLYRRRIGEQSWIQVYAGSERAFADMAAKGALPPVELPGRADNALITDRGTIYEYAVTAVNGNGEGGKSAVENSDPTGWRNWWPAGQERRFKRHTGFWLPPYVVPEAVPPLGYPN